MHIFEKSHYFSVIIKILTYFFFQKEKISEAALSSNLTTSNDSSPFTFVFIFRHFILYLFSNIVIASV